MNPDSRSSTNVGLAGDESLHRFIVDGLIECAVFTTSPGGLVTSWNLGAERLFGYAKSEIIGTPITLILPPQNTEAAVPEVELASALRGERGNHDRWYVRKDGSRLRGTRSISPFHDATGTLLGFAEVVRDVTLPFIAFEQLSHSEQKLRAVLEGVHDYAIVSLTADGIVTSWNSGAQNVFGYAAHEMIGGDFSVLYGPENIRRGVPEAELLAAQAREPAGRERILVRKDGSRFLASGKLRELKRGTNGEVRGFVNVLHDITERAAADRDLNRRAHFDEVTQLLNRGSFYEHVQTAIRSIKRRSSDAFAVMFVDIDHFKRVNDDFGHNVGDRVLGSIARRLEKCLRTGDIVARIGGDEFGILLSGIRAVRDSREAAGRIELEMRKPIDIDGGDIFATVSVGIAAGSAQYDRPEDILGDADTAMYSAKTSGRGRAVLFERPSGENSSPAEHHQ